MSSDQSVKVAVRIRPLVESEKNRGCQSIVRKTVGQPQVIVNAGAQKSEMYTFNFVFDVDDTQEMLYENAVKCMVLKLFEGYNVTILAYGQTGSGKTHTMGTTYNGTMDDEVGVIPRAITDIFDKITELDENHDFSVTCSFVELYQEKLYDLLSPNARDQSIVDIREIDGKIVIPNLTEKVVNDMVTTTNCLIQGSSDRAVSATAMNATSSRSHAIFTITVQKVPKENRSAATIAKFHLVDLAGSERSKKTLAIGEQFKEGVKINQGLLALGNVISALGSSSQSGGHIAYRDSKLTRLLQDSLGGNSLTLMIACVSPADYNCDETVGTLRYADRAKKIKNKPIINEDPKTAEINRLNAELHRMRIELLSKSGYATTVTKCIACETSPTKDQLKQEIREMNEKMQLTLFEMAQRENLLTEFEELAETINKKIIELNNEIVRLDALNTAVMDADQFDNYRKNVQTSTKTILVLTEHMKESNDCLIQTSKLSISESFKPVTLCNETSGIYIKKQTEYQEELRDVKQQLNVKEKLHTRLMENYEKFSSINGEESVQQKIIEFEMAIVKLEKEREELKEMLRNKNSNVSVKLAEERRRRVQQLEQEITEIKHKNKVQSQLLKQREKDNQQIKKLASEIQEMKQFKVKLIKKMKSESDELRQKQAELVKQCDQLRSKGKKMEYESVKKERLHEKQRIVLQRKFEESNAANKRLKEALLRLQKSRENKLNNKNGLNRSMSWLNEEIEVITSIVDIKQSFEQLNDARAELTGRLNVAISQKPQNKELIKQLKEEIFMHTAQITELADKIHSNDLEVKLQTIQDGFQTLPESRSIIKHLINNIIENRARFNMYFAQARDLKTAYETLQEEFQQKNDEHKLEIEDIKQKLDEAIQKQNQMDNENAQQAALLLKVFTNEEKNNEEIQMLREQIRKEEIELIRAEEYQRISNEMNTKRLARSRISEIRSHLSGFNDSIDTINSDIDDETKDPNWVKTPLFKTRRKTTRSISNISSENESLADVSRMNKHSKKNKTSKSQCSCRTGCKEGYCGCRKNSNGCTQNCLCSNYENCTNVFNISPKRERSTENESYDNKENDDIIPCTPKKQRTDNNIFDGTYIYSHKKRNPFLSSNLED